MDEYTPSQAYQEFESWYHDNPGLIADLQDWLFFLYAHIQKEEKGEETMIEVADMTVYLELFYFSTKNGNRYNFTVTLKELADTLETEERVVKNALNSLELHKALTYSDHDGDLDISITPIEVSDHDHHHHDHEHHHDHDHECDHDHNDHCCTHDHDHYEE